MAKATFIRVVERATTDIGFREQLKSDPETALSGCALTTEERAALISGDPVQFQLALHQRSDELTDEDLDHVAGGMASGGAERAGFESN